MAYAKETRERALALVRSGLTAKAAAAAALGRQQRRTPCARMRDLSATAQQFQMGDWETP